MIGKPGVFKCGRARLTAAQRLREEDNVELNSRRIRKAEFVFSVELKAIAFVGHAIETPRTEPVAFLSACGLPRSAVDGRFRYLRRDNNRPF